MNLKKLATFLTIIISLNFNATAQNNNNLNGIIKTENKGLLEATLINLLTATNNTLIKTTLVNKDNTFNFTNLKAGSYIINVELKGYKKYNSSIIIIDSTTPNNNTLTINLIPIMATDVNDVVVVGKVPFVETKIDRTVVNPNALIGNAGTTALEVLEKSPGVIVDINGGISLSGKPGVMVFIDDKPTFMSAQDLTNYLRSIPSSAIALIELMTNPPAKYDAAGNAGIINIKLKKIKTKGFNGGINLAYGQGIYYRTNNSINLNYRINKVNFFSNIAYTIGNSFQDLFINRKYFKPTGGVNTFFNQNSYIKKENTGANLKLGMDYYINKKATLGVVLTGFNNVNNSYTTNASTVKDSNTTIQNIVTAFAPSKRTLGNSGINLNYNYKLNPKGKELSFSADYLGYNTNTVQELLSKFYTPNGNLASRSNLVSNLPANLDIAAIKADYTNPLAKGGRFEAGFKNTYIKTKNVANFYDEVSNLLTINNDFSNNFKYNENVNAAYLNFNRDYKRFSFQTGLRLENTNITGKQLGNSVRRDSNFTRNYTNLFPTIYMQYVADTLGHNILGFSFGRRIDRPNYQDMNPFTYPLDRFTYYAGNPLLQPTFSNNFEVSHIYKNKVTTTLRYSLITDVISETIEQSTNNFYSRPGNIGKAQSYGISVNAGLKLANWWMLQLYSEVMHNKYTSQLYGQNLNNQGSYWYIGPTNQFTINKLWSAELAGSYQTSVVVGQFITIPVWQARMGISKKILKTKGTIKFNVNDMFLTNEPGGDIKAVANSTASWKSYLDTRVLTLAFSYRFSKGKSLRERQVAGADAEKNRVK